MRRMQRFGKGGALYVGHHGWPTKKILGFRWSKKVKITPENLISWRNLNDRELIDYFYQCFQLFSDEETLRKVELCVITGCFIKPF